jgi:hypothetical protein
MTQEQLRMQMLAGIITEGEYKTMLTEIKINLGVVNYNSFFQAYLDQEIDIYSSESEGDVNFSIRFLNSYRNKTVSSLDELVKYIIEIEDALTVEAGAYHGEYYGELRERLVDLCDKENFPQADELLSMLDKNYEGHY